MRTVPSVLLGLFLLAASAVSATAGETCYPDWSTAARIVVKEKLAAVKVVHQLARQRYQGDLKKITLCKSGSDYLYRLVFFAKGGRIWHLKVDARRPFQP